MTDPISNNSPKGGLPDAQDLIANVKLTPKDQNILDTPFGKMFAKNAKDEDRTTLIKEVKKALEQWIQSIMDDMKRQLKKQEETQKKLGRSLKGQDD